MHQSFFDLFLLKYYAHVVEFYESHTHTVDMFIRASEQQHQAYGYTAESECVTITANVRILHLSPFTMNCIESDLNKVSASPRYIAR